MFVTSSEIFTRVIRTASFRSPSWSILWDMCRLPAGLAVVFLLTAFTQTIPTNMFAIKGYVIASFRRFRPLLERCWNQPDLCSVGIALCIAVPLQLRHLTGPSSETDAGVYDVAVGTLLCVIPPTLLDRSIFRGSQPSNRCRIVEPSMI